MLRVATLALVALLAASCAARLLPCSAPQPRAVPSSELAEGAALQPPYVVLHRCDVSAGSCFGGSACAPTAREEVTLVFLSRADLVNREYRAVSATNHTACGCVQSHDGTASQWPW